MEFNLSEYSKTSLEVADEIMGSGDPDAIGEIIEYINIRLENERLASAIIALTFLLGEVIAGRFTDDELPTGSQKILREAITCLLHHAAYSSSTEDGENGGSNGQQHSSN